MKGEAAREGRRGLRGALLVGACAALTLTTAAPALAARPPDGTPAQQQAERCDAASADQYTCVADKSISKEDLRKIGEEAEEGIGGGPNRAGGEEAFAGILRAARSAGRDAAAPASASQTDSGSARAGVEGEPRTEETAVAGDDVEKTGGEDARDAGSESGGTAGGSTAGADPASPEDGADPNGETTGASISNAPGDAGAGIGKEGSGGNPKAEHDDSGDGGPAAPGAIRRAGGGTGGGADRDGRAAGEDGGAGGAAPGGAEDGSTGGAGSAVGGRDAARGSFRTGGALPVVGAVVLLGAGALVARRVLGG